MVNTPEDKDIHCNTFNVAKKVGFQNGVDFLQSRGIPLTREDVFLARSSSSHESPSDGSLPNTPTTSPAKSSASRTPINNYDKNVIFSPSIFREGKSPLQQYKATRAAEKKSSTSASKERIKAQAMLTESMIKRKRAEQEAKCAANRAKTTEEKRKQDNKLRRQTISDTPLLRVNMAEAFNTPGTDEGEGSELSAMSSDHMTPRSSSEHEHKRRMSSLLRGDNNTVSDETTTQSLSPLAKNGQESSEHHNLQELREDLSRMKLTIRLLKESNMNISSERQLSEEMYQDEIIKLKAALKAANLEIQCGNKTIENLSSQIEQQQSNVSEATSLPSSSEKSSTISPPQRRPISKELSRMVSITRCDSVGSTVSAADCADVKIDDIKSQLLKEFGWTEIEESDVDDKFTRLLKEIELLKQENNRLIAIMKKENIEVSSGVESKTSRPALTSNVSKRRVFSQPGSGDVPVPLSSSAFSAYPSRRASEGGVPGPSRRRNLSNECSSVSVSALKSRFQANNTSSQQR